MIETDVLMVGDFRFPGGTSTAIASEVKALTDAGYRVVLLAYATKFLRWTRDFHPEISKLLKLDGVTMVPPGTAVRAGLMCLHHPSCFEQLPAEPFLARADHAVLVVHHPPVDADGVPQYDVGRIKSVLASLVGGAVPWAPVGPKVRTAFASLPGSPALTAGDWVNILNAGDFTGPRPGPVGALPVLGRHSRADPVKWPETRAAMLAAYPDVPDIRVRLMGMEPEAFDWLETLPANWEVLPFGAMPPGAFLETIDYLSYFHSEAWIEAFGRSVLEALAAGIVCFLPKHFEEVFGDAGVYCAPDAVAGLVREMQAKPALYARQSINAVALVRDAYGPERAVARVRELIGAPSGVSEVPAKPAPLPRVMYLTSNGVGMGHLTRVLALARRHKGRAEPIIVSMSRAIRVARSEGFLTEYIPFFRSSGMDHDHWHALLRIELIEMFRFYKPSVVVLDGNVPYRGMIDALDAFPGIKRVWLRRAMWPPDVGERFLRWTTSFDAVLEPGEVAGALDRGLTKSYTQRLRKVPPVSYLARDEAMSRATARAVLGLDAARPAVFLQLGSGNNIRTGDMRQMIIDKLNRDIEGPTPQIVVGQWQIGRRDQSLAPEIIELGTFPFARYLKAFDFAVAMAGYNTFHENLRACLPTLFLSNEHPEQDEQWLRADYARINGLALAARAGNSFDVLRGVYELSRKDVRDRISAACAALDIPNGADEAAKFLGDLAYCSKPHVADVVNDA